ncbi:MULTISPECIES: NRAMP family divalent metal transporter [unclassified Pseudomonas]|uniref:NRAMP family divalent metal transporter n=1 Tax=unclassified Pseudomonas TaxID=196821 RepID=UPI002AC8EDE5|nr:MULTISPECIES: divalent metal cation transporter [unclassified Pseudomonas]MEB0046462.1 divalent metal cation transporter [Pseudomonas sp. Dout3]MEB0097888.1 divalent metal cation transporter [Pseudomonas sp. DC1.2]WPX59516.1 divalent metal cation transporter [Pseudomonas sp. DC1.2]
MSDLSADPPAFRRRLTRLLATMGPGLVVMMADTEAGSVITAAQSGAQWGYRLLLLQFLLVPLMFMAQELTVRLGLCTGKGYVELVRQHFGRGLAAVTALVLLLSCFGSLLTQMSGLVGAGSLFAIPGWLILLTLVVFILGMVLTGSYRSVERVTLAVGMFGLAFVVMAIKAQPDIPQILHDLARMPLNNPDYLYLLAANLGTSVMPWTVFYQQSALIDKGLDATHLPIARIDTLVGAVFCQVLTASIVIAAAATLGGHAAGLDSIAQIGQAFGALIGPTWGELVFAIGLAGGALVATIVVCLSAVWAVGEALGVRHSLEQHPLDAPWFYGPFALLLIGGALLVASGVNLIRLSIAVGVLNALLIPLILLLLFLLARSVLPPEHRLRGRYARVVAVIFTLTSVLGLYAGLCGSLG